MPDRENHKYKLFKHVFYVVLLYNDNDNNLHETKRIQMNRVMVKKHTCSFVVE